MKNYKELKVWQRGLEIVAGTYGLVRQLPREEISRGNLWLTKPNDSGGRFHSFEHSGRQ